MGKLIVMPKSGPHSFPLRRGPKGRLLNVLHPNLSYHLVLFTEIGGRRFENEKELKKEARVVLKHRLKDQNLGKKQRKEYVDYLINLGKEQGWICRDKDGHVWLALNVDKSS